jgi:positive regulator of sigma E activity
MRPISSREGWGQALLSCQTRSFCPSCAAKRAAIFGAYLAEEVVPEVGHAQWV